MHYSFDPFIYDRISILKIPLWNTRDDRYNISNINLHICYAYFSNLRKLFNRQIKHNYCVCNFDFIDS